MPMPCACSCLVSSLIPCSPGCLHRLPVSEVLPLAPLPILGGHGPTDTLYQQPLHLEALAAHHFHLGRGGRAGMRGVQDLIHLSVVQDLIHLSGVQDLIHLSGVQDLIHLSGAYAHPL